ncbi:glycosyltransferase family 4 protein [Iamia sp. SCSIO 61187]|uniref:glycosyltransferase family 4 protein n=1 Tax=Iamia sp. SCSIO 61187 TaxID=2722752 RepID=UPI001C636E7E|nr:glycosyltransferase family 4 protein [Iamia sp. SCSIO 61187]QYG93019.1 glycosyltransferase family 4 protein [Iamia sp. SCSIO 61187]
MTIPSAPLPKLGDIAAAAGLHRVHMIAWRDLDDVEAGGSEVHAATVARLWSEAGLDVLMRTSWAQGHPNHDRRDGYEVIRKAGRYQVFPRTALAEIRRAYGRPDGLVEIWNGMPFFSPLWATVPRVVLLHHVHGDMWNMVLPPNLARVGDTVERRIAPLIYRRSRMITLSPSSKEEMVELGFRPDRVDVVPPGVDPRFTPAPPGTPRSEHPLIVGVGRLAPVKRWDRLIRAAVVARETAPDLELVIAGTGPQRTELQDLIDGLDGRSWITLPGRVSDDEQLDLYRRAWAVASSSVREGWNMTLTEAAACGTPAVATRIAGQVDAVADGTSGLLADDDAELARHLVAITSDPAVRDRLAAGALAHSAQFTWEATARSILTALAEEAERWRDRPWRSWRAR